MKLEFIGIHQVFISIFFVCMNMAFLTVIIFRVNYHGANGVERQHLAVGLNENWRAIGNYFLLTNKQQGSSSRSDKQTIHHHRHLHCCQFLLLPHKTSNSNPQISSQNLQLFLSTQSPIKLLVYLLDQIF